ncbi:hypothetical protein POTOM_042975 [Populus tomentosa]|uniref:SNF2 N-terminal domain-containing protein n=1 Tax=Populus tomentosa TaxID=118781 RepID=A0A8X8CGY2_POPTO|nr:hypothetical protein POTOM_042975 [Populus tomentosa]
MAMALLAHLACGKGIWGPRLIVVPTGVKLDWETEFLKWCPAFKIVAYFGSAKDCKCKWNSRAGLVIQVERSMLFHFHAIFLFWLVSKNAEGETKIRKELKDYSSHES